MTTVWEQGDDIDPARTGRVAVRMIGPLTIIRPDGPRSGRELGAVKTRSLLELLLLSRGRALSKDELIHALWDGSKNMPADPSRTLEHYVCVLRGTLTSDRTLSRALLRTGTNSYVIDPDLLDLDIERFEALMRRAATATPAEQRDLLEQAVALAADDLLADSPSPELARIERATHRETVSALHLWLADAALGARELHRTVWHGEAALRFTPCSEHAYRVLMVAHHALGSTDLARLTYRRCVTALQRELAIEPTAQTTAVAAAVQTGAGVDELVALLRRADAT